MLNNLTNFFNIITGRMMKKTPDATDLIALGTKNPRYGGGYKPTGILYSDLKADILAGVVPGSDCCSVDAEGNYIAANSSDDLVDVGNGASHDIPDFSGMLIVNDHYNGSVELWLCGGGPTAVLVSATAYGPGAGDVTINGGISGYTWTNTNNQIGPFTFTVIKTRNEA